MMSFSFIVVKPAIIQVVRVRLPHCPLPDTKDICLIVKDLQKGIKVDHEDTVNHFSQLLQEKGVAAKVEISNLSP